VGRGGGAEIMWMQWKEKTPWVGEISCLLTEENHRFEFSNSDGDIPPDDQRDSRPTSQYATTTSTFSRFIIRQSMTSYSVRVAGDTSCAPLPLHLPCLSNTRKKIHGTSCMHHAHLRVLRPTHPPIQWIRGGSFPGGKAAWA
jgi:hypothetical protein